jgi:hypothetical protein
LVAAINQSSESNQRLGWCARHPAGKPASFFVDTRRNIQICDIFTTAVGKVAPKAAIDAKTCRLGENLAAR